MNDQQISNSKTTVLGGGSMGTALAKLICDSGSKVTLWVYEPELAAHINERHENTTYLAGYRLPDTLTATSSLKEALAGASTILSVTPAQVLRSVWKEAVAYLPHDASIICASKGIETGSAKLMSQVLEEILPTGFSSKLAYLSGPSFAKEIVDGQPTAVVIASTNEQLAIQSQKLISTPSFRSYTTDDVIGVELGGALKNVVAIAVGAAEGMGLGLNSRAALITRGLAEISRLAVAAGANPLTLAGLAGVGDLILTCNGHLSRNLQVGIRLGKGDTIKEILADMNMVAEGVATARSTLLLAEQLNIEMPIAEVVVQLLDLNLTPKEALSRLMSRRLRSEREY